MLTNNIKLPETHLIIMFCLNAKWTWKKNLFHSTAEILTLITYIPLLMLPRLHWSTVGCYSTKQSMFHYFLEE